MPRTMTSGFLAALVSGLLRPAIFVEANFSDGPVRVWTGGTNLSWNGHTWLGAGAALSFSTMEEVSNVNARGITATMSGIPSSFLTEVLSHFRLGLPVTVWLGLFDDTHALIPDPVTSWAGRMDQPTLDADGQTASLAINCESRLVDMDNSVDRRYTNDDQQIDHPGDLGLEFVNSIQNTVIYWGRTPWHGGQ